jgi:hypothetical protein
LLCALAIGSARADLRPQPPLVERSAFGDSLNFDIVVPNPTAQPLYLGSIEVAYLDGEGRELYARTLDHQGRGLDTVPDLVIPPNAEKLVYNPFPILPPDVKPRKVRVRVTLYKPRASRAEPLESVLAQEFQANVAERQAQALRFPMKGRIWIWDGHDLTSHHRRWDYTTSGMKSFGIMSNAGRYSYDFVVVDEQNRMWTKDDEKNESSLTFGAPITAPGAGVVIEAVGTKADDKNFGMDEAKANPNTTFGNYVVIDHGNGLFSLLGHMKQGSVKVKAGDRVVAGQLIGGAGASGSSLFPHLHYQLMNGPRIGTAEGVPSYFDGLSIVRGAGQTPLRPVSIDSGDIVIAR